MAFSLTENVEKWNRATNTVGSSRLKLRLGVSYLASDFSGLEAGSADILALRVTVYESADALDIWIPTTTGTTV
jgi:hypothetical protein